LSSKWKGANDAFAKSDLSMKPLFPTSRKSKAELYSFLSIDETVAINIQHFKHQALAVCRSSFLFPCYFKPCILLFLFLKLFLYLLFALSLCALLPFCALRVVCGVCGVWPLQHPAARAHICSQDPKHSGYWLRTPSLIFM
jgi:hypothetical protein